MTAVTAPAAAVRPRNRLTQSLADTLAIAWRKLITIVRLP